MGEGRVRGKKVIPLYSSIGSDVVAAVGYFGRNSISCDQFEHSVVRYALYSIRKSWFYRTPSCHCSKDSPLLHPDEAPVVQNFQSSTLKVIVKIRRVVKVRRGEVPAGVVSWPLDPKVNESK